MVLETRCAPGGTLRMIQEEQESQKYCYPFKEYDPTGSKMSHQNNGSISQRMRGGNGTISQASRGLGLDKMSSSIRSSRSDLYSNIESANNWNQNVPPAVPTTEPPPLPPRRSTSLFGGVGTTLTLLRIPKPRESSTLNPKRISIATSSFWTGHPDMAHFSSGWELGQNSMRTQSVWGTTERGGCPVTESVDIWGDPPSVKKGILLQQRDKMLWSRWKERYFILTRDYLNCFRRTTTVHRSGVRLSEMGSFIYKLRLAEVDGIEWETRKNGSMIVLILPQEPKILLRVPGENYETLHQWYTLLQECIYMSKERRRALRSQHGSLQRSTTTTSYNPNASKSTGSASPNSSSKSSSSNSKSASNSDLDRLGSDGEKSLKKQHSISRSGSGLLALRKISGGSSPRSLLIAPGGGSGKYSPLLGNEEEEEDDYQEAPVMPQPQKHLISNNNSRMGSDNNLNSQHSNNINNNDEFKVTLRRRREMNNNNGIVGGGGGGLLMAPSNPGWRLSLAQPPSHGYPTGNFEQTEGYGMNSHNINNSVRVRKLSPNGSGYSTPIDARPRPESWTPQPTMFYRTSSLVPSQWINKRDLQNNSVQGGGGGNFCNNNNIGYGSARGNFNMRPPPNVVFCPSRITPDVAFRKMS